MRGIGALMVGGFHAAGLAGGPTLAGIYAAWILGFFFDGRTGVSIFFVLSGLVLGMSLRRAGSVTAWNYFHFCGRRFFRLFPAYFFSTLFYLALYFGLWDRAAHGLPVGNGWCDYYLRDGAWKWTHLAGNFCFVRQSLNVATWTLRVEALAAFILPLLHAFSLRFRGKGAALMLLALVMLSFSASGGGTRLNLYLFYLGYWIPPLIENLRASGHLGKIMNNGWAVALALAALAASHPLQVNPGAHIGLLLAGLGSTALLLMILLSSHPIFSVLDHRVVRYFGKVSYSYYLFNLLSVDLVQRVLLSAPTDETTRRLIIEWLIFPASTILCLAMASVSFYLVERPFIRLGGFLLPSFTDPNASDRAKATDVVPKA